MTLRQSIQDGYVDADGLVLPKQNTASNNGVLYTSEYMIELIRNHEAMADDGALFVAQMMQCMPTPGLLQRNPENGGGQEGPDDYYGLAAALDEIGTPTARGCASLVVKYALKHLGSMDNVTPGSFQWDAFLVRQPQLVAVTLWAAGDFVGPLLRLICALTILFACPDTDDLSSWRLSWMMVQVARRHSLLCRLASLSWYRRFYSRFKWGMVTVNASYFQPTHPLSIYAVDKA